MLFDRLWKIQTGLVLDVLKARFGTLENLAAADIGCMDGRAETALAGNFGRLAASDLVEANLQKARARGLAGVEWKLQPPVGNPVRLVFKNDEFDAVTAFSLFHHYDGPARVQTLAEFSRIVRPGGLAVIFEANPYCPIVAPWFAVQSRIEGDRFRLITLKRLRAEAESVGWALQDAYVLRPPLPMSLTALNVKYLPEFFGGPKYALVLRNRKAGAAK